MLMITGASGQLGRRIAEHLKPALSHQAIAMLTREPAKISDLAAAGFTVRAGDFDQPESLAQSFAGVETLLIISTDGPNPVRVRQHRQAIEAAVKAGVRQLAYTSVAGVGSGLPNALLDVHRETEALIQATGLPYLIFRNNIYLDSLPMLLGPYAQTGKVSMPTGTGKVAWISRDNLAEATARALLSFDGVSRVLHFDHPEAWSFPQIASLLRVSFSEPEPREFVAGLIQSGLPDFVAELFLAICDAVRADAFSGGSEDIQGFLNQPLDSVKELLARR